MRSFIPVLLLTGILAIEPSLSAEPDPADKWQYHLLNPTPREFMRDLSADRPDFTESPYTVDAGHFQIEADLFNYTRDRDRSGSRNVKFEAYSVGSLNLKAGLLNNVDLQLIVDSYVHERVEDRVASTRDSASGFGDVQTRLKINLWGNDEGTTAFGIMPFVKFPTAGSGLGNDSVEGGLILPFAAGLPAGWNLGVMAEFDFLRDEIGSGYHTEFVQTVAAGRDIAGNLGGYLEFISIFGSRSDSDWRALAGLGLVYGWTENLVLDAGVNIGLTDAADDVNPFVGVTYRH
jgi:hypothetical protein